MASGVKLLEGYVEVTADGKSIPGDIAKEVDNDAGKAHAAGQGFGKRIVGGIVGSVVAVKIGQFIGDSITAGSDLAETMNKATTIFGDQAGALDKWGDSAATTLGLSKSAALAAASGFGDMFTQLGFASDAAAQMSQSTVQMAADLGSFHNVPTADVADRISAAFRGEYDSLQALIPNINAARVEQEAMAATGKTNAAELTAQEKAAAVLAIVNKDGAAAMGDFAKTADSAANQQKTAASQTEDLKAALGTGLLPVVQEVLGVVTSQFLPMLQDFAKWISENEALIIPLSIAFGILAAAIWVVNIAMYANPIGLLVAAIVIGIGLLIAAVVFLATNWEQIMGGIAIMWEQFAAWVGAVIEGFVGWVTAVWNGFINFLVAVVVGYLSFWLGVWNSIASFFIGVWNNIVNFGRTAITNLVGFFTALPGQIMGAISGAATWLLNVGRDIIGGLRRGIEGAWNGMVSWFRGLFGDLIGIAKKILGIASPSRVFKYEVGAMLPAGIEEGVELGMPSLNRTIANMVTIPTAPSASTARANSLAPSAVSAAGGGNMYVDVHEAEDPLGTVGRIGREWNKWKRA